MWKKLFTIQSSSSLPSCYLCFRSGTVFVEEVDDFISPTLNKRGEIGINLSEETSICIAWINKQIRSGPGRLSCRTPCAPTYGLARRRLRATGRWRSLFKRRKLMFGGLRSRCVMSNYRTSDTTEVECCYFPFRPRYLLNVREIGSGRVHAHHPERFGERDAETELYEEEEDAYNDCCFGPISSTTCPLFYSFRPPCGSAGWVSGGKTWGKSF